MVDSTRSEIVLNFLHNLHSIYDLNGSVIVLDNHRAHTSNIVKEFANSIDCELLFLPPVTGMFNPIETVWSLVKRLWRKELMTVDTDRQTEQWMRSKLQEICESIPDDHLQKLAYCHLREIGEYLREIEIDPFTNRLWERRLEMGWDPETYTAASTKRHYWV